MARTRGEIGIFRRAKDSTGVGSGVVGSGVVGRVGDGQPVVAGA